MDKITVTRLYILRHGEVANHLERRYNGHHDVDITDLGVEQIKLAGEFIRDNHPQGNAITKIYSSDLIRSKKGGEILSNILSVPLEEKQELREISFGRWDGLTKEEAHTKYPEETHIAFKNLATESFKGGESLVDLKNRAIPIIEDFIDAHSGESLCLVLHGGINRLILCHILGLDLANFFKMEQDYGCINIIDAYSDGHRVAKLINGGPNQKINKTPLY